MLTVSFIENPRDEYFTHAQLYLRLGTNGPFLIAESPSSPLVATVARTNQLATIFVVSAGRWNSTAIADSPAQALSLNPTRKNESEEK